jgi:cephalosporin hydroxylase
VDYFEIRNKVNSDFIGYIPNFDIAIMDYLLSSQKKNDIRGKILELGTYKGKTASFLNFHSDIGELLLVDLYFHFTEEEWGNLNSITPGVKFIVGSTSSSKVIKQMRKEKQSMRFVHCDTSHTYMDTKADLAIAAGVLNKSGIICVDDFCNLDYPGVLPAVYDFLIKNKRKFRLFLVTQQKAYICRTEMFDFYSKVCSVTLIDQMQLRGEKAYISRTDSHYLSSCTYLGNNTDNAKPDVYGDKEFLHFFS